ncbi:Transmembrane protein of unknown function [Actinacidiphila yanglinensis]|uniref:DUF3566 domain-containing protein n=1 Tax=Actinacidiphila yanglinensis TaxID=310779 RepID=A0A1H6A7I2_9ACTN|nr:DUF3566 domain-containing protein [Actinacidiphila yanglinensis]SEG43696.1 Transmembrane protein of unknown function [Actinacidiphila yanglinensis]
MGAAGGSGRPGGAHGAGRTGGAHGSAGGAGAGGAGPAGPADQQGPQEGGYTVTDTRQSPHQPPAAYAPPQPPGAPPGMSMSKGSAAAAGVRRPRPAARTVPRTRKARLRVAKADPWSVMKVSFLLSIALGICTIIAVAVLWMVLDTIGVFSTVGSTINDATSTEGGKGGFDLVSFLSLSRVMLFTTVIAVIDVVLATALATLGAFIYNLSSGFVGGIELTLAEDE